MMRVAAVLFSLGLASNTLVEADLNGAVMEGFDVVAYQSLSEGASGVLGSTDYVYNLTSTDQGVDIGPYEFRFATADNLATFAADPWTYAPKFGGF